MWKQKNNTIMQSRACRKTTILFREQQLCELYKQLHEQQINDYIQKRYAKKLSENEFPNTSPITNYIPHHGFLNVNKPNKVYVVFDLATIYHETSLNDNLLPGIDLLNNLVSITISIKVNIPFFATLKPCVTRCLYEALIVIL